LYKLIHHLSAWIKWIGEKSAWLNLALVFLISFDVMQRYLFNQSFNAVLELEWHIFGLIFLLGSAYTLQMDKHVRVDVFYHSFSPKTKALIDILGSLILLIPWCIIGIMTCHKYAANSFYINENSPNPGGLPAWYIIKYFIVICFILLILQALLLIFEKVKSLTK
jgi:TRAP-type mannitol/chloroaromatic compound transport system permease small subunit